METFDYVIVGAGTAGCVVANRLSADGRTRVLLLEAGGTDRRMWIQLPIGYGRLLFNPAINWMYETESEPALGGRTSFWPRGKKPRSANVRPSRPAARSPASLRR